MKEDEIKFFKTCYKYCSKLTTNYRGMFQIRDVINVCSEFINYKRCWYLLRKWNNMGFYNYGVCLDLGWFSSDLPLKYYDLIKEEEI